MKRSYFAAVPKYKTCEEFRKNNVKLLHFTMQANAA
jgi:hypothetical protein